ncbi:phosphatase PAP2 family protein [Fusibacter bizertensis]
MELNFIHWVQSFHTNVLDQLFILITMLGEEYFYILLLGFMYWCVNKEVTRYLVLCLTFSSVLNGAMKEIVNSQRPFLVADVRALRVETATGSSFPSGHTQTVVSFYLALALKLKKAWAWILGITLVILVGLSRIYLGVHWPRDVVGAIILGTVSVALMIFIYKKEQEKNIKWPYYLLILAIGGSFLFLQSETYIKGSAAFLGFIIGTSIERQYIRFDALNKPMIQLIKFLGGMCVTGGIFLGMKFILPDTVLFIGIRYFITVFSVAAITPWIFIKLGFSKSVKN